jgi:excisionase family DNA binding protein
VTLAVHTLDEAAAILRVKPSWLERQAAARKIPFSMLGGSYRFTADHLAAIVAQHEYRPAPSDDFTPEPRRRQSREVPRRNEMPPSVLRPRPLASRRPAVA